MDCLHHFALRDLPRFDERVQPLSKCLRVCAQLGCNALHLQLLTLVLKDQVLPGKPTDQLQGRHIVAQCRLHKDLHLFLNRLHPHRNLPTP
eukprot:6463013-Amphidinium_carterae.1